MRRLACGLAGSSSLSDTRWSVLGTVRCQLLPVRPQNHTLPALTGPPCNLCPAAPAAASSSPTPPPSCKTCESYTPECACHLDLTLGVFSLKLVSRGGDEADFLKEEGKWAVGRGDSTGHLVEY